MKDVLAFDTIAAGCDAVESEPERSDGAGEYEEGATGEVRAEDAPVREIVCSPIRVTVRFSSISRVASWKSSSSKNSES